MHVTHEVVDPLVGICRLVALAFPQSGLREDDDVQFGAFKKPFDVVGMFVCIENSAQRH